MNHWKISATSLFFAILMIGTAQADGPFSKINIQKNPKHTPVIEAPASVKAGEAFMVTVKVGETMHPSDVGHSVQWIELYAGDVQIARASFTPTLTQPVVTFSVMLQESTTLRALSAPNHSAAWEAIKKIQVTK